MDPENFTLAVSCWIDELMQELASNPDWRRTRQRVPAPTLAESEVITIVTVGEGPGLDQDVASTRSVRRHHPDFFPALSRVQLTIFTRQAAKWWVVGERLWRRRLDRLPYDPALSCVDSVPTPVCRFGRAWGCSRFRGQAAFGRDSGSKATIYGFRAHLRLNAPGVVTAVSVAPANVRDRHLVPELVEGATGQVLGDRNDWDPKLTAVLPPACITVLAPFKKRARDPQPLGSRDLTRVRWRIETGAAHLVERFHLKRIWARDAWQLTSRVLRKVLSQTLAVVFCLERGDPPLQFDRLLHEHANLHVASIAETASAAQAIRRSISMRPSSPFRGQHQLEGDPQRSKPRSRSNDRRRPSHRTRSRYYRVGRCRPGGLIPHLRLPVAVGTSPQRTRNPAGPHTPPYVHVNAAARLAAQLQTA